jgi:hypothetical protein
MLSLPLEDTDSTPKNGGKARLIWDISVKSPGKIILGSGGTLNEMEGKLFVSIGDASPLGKTRRDDDSGDSWGALYYFKELYNLLLYVSPAIFDRLIYLSDRARIPDVEITTGIRTREIKTRQVAYFVDWDNLVYESVDVEHCKFSVQLGARESL